MTDTMHIYIFGGGGHAKVIMDVLRRAFGNHCIGGLYDDDPAKTGQPFYQSTIIGPLNATGIDQLMIAIGDNHTRKEVYSRIAGVVRNFITAVDPAACVSSSADVGAGTAVMPGVCINADAKIGRHVILNTNATIEHDCYIGDFVHIAPGAVLTGGVTVGDLTMVGANATIVPGKTIGINCLVGAGSVVTKNVPDHCFVFGNPAKIISRRRKMNAP